MAKRGRPRKQGAARTPSGQISRAADPTILHETLVQRAQAVGVTLTREREAVMRDQRVGTALGVLWARGLEHRPGIDERQYRAGESLGALWRRWAGMVAAPPRTALRSEGGSPSGDPDAEAWRRTDAEFKSLRLDVWALPAGVPAWRMLERIVMDDAVPVALDTPGVLDAVQRALDLVAKHFRIPKDLAA